MSFDLAIDKIILYQRSPLTMVRDLFGIEPDIWQREVLDDFITNPAQVMACCKGPGKTAVLAWLCWNFLLTRMHPKIGAISITGKNLHDNLWPEMAKWQKRSALLTNLFEWGSERIALKAHPETWFMSARTWPQSANEQELGETLAGLWAENVMFVLDEAGGIPIPVMRTAEAVLGQARDGKREAHIVMAGNTTSNTGCLYEAAITRRHLWKVYEITADPDDPKRTQRIDLEYSRRQIAEYGRDNPWVMINILARFPSQGVNQMISADQIKDCMGRHLHLHAYDWAPRILGGDPAEFGDDRSVLFPRQGLAYFTPLVLREMDSIQIAGHWGAKALEWDAHSIQIDSTGGYGAGPISILRDRGFSVVGANFSEKPFNARFYNKRAEMIWTLCEHLKEGASLPREGCDDIIAELSSMTYGYKNDKIIVEDKKLIKARLGRSPDLADAAACTHAYPVSPPESTRSALFPHLGFDGGGVVGKSRTEYDPLTRG